MAVGFGLSVAAPFGWRCPSNLAVAPFPHPSRRTERAPLAHSALGQDIRGHLKKGAITYAKEQRAHHIIVLVKAPLARAV